MNTNEPYLYCFLLIINSDHLESESERNLI